MFLFSAILCNTSSFSKPSVQLITAILLQHHISWPYKTVLYEIDNTPPVFIKWRCIKIWTLLLSLFSYSLEGECVPSTAMHVELPCFFLWHNFFLNSIEPWASASELIQNELMIWINPWTLTLQFKILHGLGLICVCVFVCVYVCGFKYNS